MKLEKILDSLNSLEKNSFIKIIDSIITNGPKNQKDVDKIISESDKSDIKNLENVVISKIFGLIQDEFAQLITAEFVDTSSQLDILIDIIIRDGNCIMKHDWFASLYQTELLNISKKIKELQKELDNPKSDLSEDRKRGYKIYQSCVYTAFYNDLENNQESKVTRNELSILLTLSQQLELSQEEVKLINYLTIPFKKEETDYIITELKNLGVIFFSRKTKTVFVADEMVRLLRNIRQKEIADKFFRRILRSLREPQINLICRKHNINRKSSIEQKIKDIIHEGLSFSKVLTNDVHKNGISLSDKKRFIDDLYTKTTSFTLKGATLEDKIVNLIAHFETVERDEKVGISVDGYEKLLTDLGEALPELNTQIKLEFELQDDKLTSSLLLDYNIKPRDILDIIALQDLTTFCEVKEITTRKNIIQNILDTYKDADNLYLENYVNIGFRDLSSLKENGIRIKETELGIKFEELTKLIFTQLGLKVDESLRKQLNTKKDKIDILLNLGNKELILIECKTVKESGYNKFSSVSRQMNSYVKLAKEKDFKIVKSLLIAPEFSDDFVNDTEMEFELNLSLIKAESLLMILEGFKMVKKHKSFPYRLLMKDVLIDEERIIKAMKK